MSNSIFCKKEPIKIKSTQIIRAATCTSLFDVCTYYLIMAAGWMIAHALAAIFDLEIAGNYWGTSSRYASYEPRDGVIRIIFL